MISRIADYHWWMLALVCLSGTVRAADPCSSAVLGHDIVSTTATLSAARPNHCSTAVSSCSYLDAIVFVHGIYGNDSTFVNSDTHFDWPKEFPEEIEIGGGRGVDVFRLDYQTSLLSWARIKIRILSALRAHLWRQ